MKSIAIVGFSEVSREMVKDSTADEIWTVNFAWELDFLPRIDRSFEIHPLWLYPQRAKRGTINTSKHWDWLRKEHDFPVYLMELNQEIPSGEVYPIDKLNKHFFDPIGMDPYYSCSFAFMMALAIYEHDTVEPIERIESYGFEMKITDTEYGYQRPGAEFWIGAATVGRGIEFSSPDKLAKAPVYAYERLQMILRQDLERHLINYKNQRDKHLALMNQANGKRELLERVGGGNKSKGWVDAMNEEMKHLKNFNMAEGAVQATEHFLKVIDLEEPDLELVSNLTQYETGGEAKR